MPEINDNSKAKVAFRLTFCAPPLLPFIPVTAFAARQPLSALPRVCLGSASKKTDTELKAQHLEVLGFDSRIRSLYKKMIELRDEKS